MSRKVHFAYQGDTWELERTVFRYGHTDHHLPRVIIIAAIHGNEPTGLRALLELKPALREYSAQMNGEVIGLIGNFRALEHNRRFIDKDLNRMWSDRIQPAGRSEDHEKEELNLLLRDFLSGAGPRFVLDLHTTSADSKPFISVSDTDINRTFIANFNMPGITGIERFIEGPLLHYISLKGHVGLAFEAGQHTDPKSVDKHVEFIKEALHHSGVLTSNRYLNGKEGKEYDIIYRHGITSEDEFIMNPGYHNFQRIHKGQILAHDRQGVIRAPKDGLLFMPLYQNEGS
ncbi:MAG: hypothetical protein HKO93_08095, partial [Flavobacteriales bacterium]|nr:hypothetical protein [Flavobacteriales bacterium]